MKRKIIFFIIGLFALNLYIPVFATDGEEETETNEPYYGMSIMSDEQTHAFNETLPRIVSVKPNSIAMERINNVQMYSNEDKISEEDIYPIGEEIECIYPNETSGSAGSSVGFELPTNVDITKSLTFPSIGNQGSVNSCVAWSLGYYQLTNNTCLVRGINARNTNGSNISQNVINPMWIYPLINGGRDNGAWYVEGCAAIMSYGAPTYSEYSGTSKTAWSTSSSVWNAAMNNKPMQISYSYMNIDKPVTSTDSEVIKLKQILSNGYVVTIPVDYATFEWTKRTSNNEYACRYARELRYNETSLGHALTVVGYDDNMWIDINGNNNRDEGEYGAFKIANSWGRNGKYCSNGCFWIAYDAIGVESGVTNLSSISKVPAFSMYYLLQPKQNYEPLYVANVQMTAKDRNQISISIGISGVDETSPAKILTVSNDYYIAFNEANKTFLGHYDGWTISKRTFSGSTSLSENTITIPFDITPVIKMLYSNSGMTYGQPIKIYVTVGDNMNDSNYTYLKTVSVTETATNTITTCTDRSSLRANNSTVTKSLSITPNMFIGSYKEQEITLNFNSNVLPQSVTSQNLYATDYNGNLLNFITNVNENRIVLQPDNDMNTFVYDSVYNLTIENNILSQGGNSLSNTLKIPIYILDKYYSWRNYDVY